MQGATIPGSVYAWVIVFVLPVNSAINPIVYTFSTKHPIQVGALKSPSTKKELGCFFFNCNNKHNLPVEGTISLICWSVINDVNVSRNDVVC